MGSSGQSIRVACSGCQKKMAVADRHAGKSFPCPECGTSLKVPNPKQAAVAANQRVQATAATSSLDTPSAPPRLPPSRVSRKADNRKSLESTLQGLSGDFPRPRVSLGYRLTALVVAVGMLLLPMIYMTLVAAVGWATYWHASTNWYWVTQVRGRGVIIVGVFYLGGILIGALWTLSMLKPLFRNWGGTSKQEGLSRVKERYLYEFADRIAQLVGSPKPDVIRLSVDANASASFQTGMFGLFRKQFCLTIGLPLLAGLTSAQLAGVIAHEFGHFSQTRGLFLSRLILRINNWFGEAIYQRDWVDAVIEEMGETDMWTIQILGFIAWCAVGIGRGILWCLMIVGLALSGTLSRQMEYDADQYECGLVGSEIYTRTSEQFMELTVAYAIASEFILSSHSASYLPNNFPSFVAGLAEKSKKVKKKARKLIRDEPRSWFASHPVVRDRIAAAERLDRPGIFHSKLAAKHLLKDYKKHAEGLTLFIYAVNFDGNVDPENLRDTSDALENFLATLGPSGKA